MTKNNEFIAKIEKKEFASVIAEMVMAMNPECNAEAKEESITIIVSGCPYVDVDMRIFYAGYMINAISLTQVAKVVADISKGTDFTGTPLEEVIKTRKDSNTHEKGRHDYSGTPSMSYLVDRWCEENGIKARDDNEAFRLFIMENVELAVNQNGFGDIGNENIKDVIGDVELTCVVIDYSNGGCFTLKKNTLDFTGLSLKEIKDHAVMNTMRKHGPVMVEQKEKFFCVSSDSPFFGAATMLYHGFLKVMAEQFGEDLYVAPAFKGGIIFVPKYNATVAEMYEHQEKSNKKLPDWNKLSDMIFIYKKETDELIPVDHDGKFCGKPYKVCRDNICMSRVN